VVGLERWGGGARRQQSWLCQSGSRASAVQRRLGTAALLECERLLSLCGGGKLASGGGALGVDRGYRRLFVVGLTRWGGGARRQRAGFAKAAAGLPQSKVALEPQRFLSASACSRFVAEGSLLPGVGRWAWIAVFGGFSWLGSHAGVVVRAASRLALPKRQQGFRSPKASWKRSAFLGVFDLHSATPPSNPPFAPPET